MRYIALATDYDGTLAHDGAVADSTIAALERLRQSRRKLILVTGRELPDLELVFPRWTLFDRIVAENGAVLYTPATREKQVLAEAPDPTLVEMLRERGVTPLSVGDSIVATWRPHENTVLEVIRDLGLELHVVFNKGAVMILPANVNKMSGLKAALKTLGISEHNTVAVGDAENDHAFLKWCEFSAAVANALPSLKETADVTTRADHGAGVEELIERILTDDLASCDPPRRALEIAREGESPVCIRAYGSSLLVAGASGSGKSTFVAGLLESLIEKHYQVCLIDPEGDYDTFPGTVAIGDDKHAASTEQVLQALEKTSAEVVAHFGGTPVEDRPALFSTLAPRLEELRLRSGRPHWIIIDEAHQMLPQGWAPGSAELAGAWKNLVLITVHPDRVPASALRTVDVVVAIGPSAGTVITDFAGATGVAAPVVPPGELGQGQGLIWLRERSEVHRARLIESKAARERHRRKYARGELGEDISFYFRGPAKKLNLRAHNLVMFLQIADGVDDETWLYHLKCADYSRWFRKAIKDEALAADAEQVERHDRDPRSSRDKIRAAIEQRYTAPA
jgi:HAD superfamily hydrolase (TIGR01484 family)